NRAGVIGIHETNRSGLMQFVPEFLKSRTTHNISLLLIFWSLWPLPGYPPQRIPGIRVAQGGAGAPHRTNRRTAKIRPAASRMAPCGDVSGAMQSVRPASFAAAKTMAETR